MATHPQQPASPHSPVKTEEEEEADRGRLFIKDIVGIVVYYDSVLSTATNFDQDLRYLVPVGKELLFASARKYDFLTVIRCSSYYKALRIVYKAIRGRN